MNIDQRYQETLDYIYTYIENSLTHQKHLSLKDSDLSRMVTLMDSLGNPQRNYPCIHVAGSKGKGSVSAFCATALQTAGYKVGLYTSPHLRDFEERIQINWEPISREDFVELVDFLKPHIATIPKINTFEIATALAFYYFRKQAVDIAVIEVGLGGRLDATNVITPRVSVITALYLEHTNILGNTLSQIAYEKAGIIKPGIPVVLSPQREEARQMVTKIAIEKKAPLTQVGIDYTFETKHSCLESQTFTIQSVESGELSEIEIGLLGQHQVENASTAYVALQRLREQGIPISESAIQEGFAHTRWPARFEILNREPPIVVDSAHNPDSARKLRETMDEYFPGRPLVLVFGVSEDKNITGMIQELNPGTRLFICSQSTHPRAMDSNALKDLVAPFGSRVVAINPVNEALEEAIRVAGSDAVVLVTGSIFVAATARIAWFENMKNKWRNNAGS
jgi:dihydrofolate synthase/folylpolyglutamate synthase